MIRGNAGPPRGLRRAAAFWPAGWPLAVGLGLAGIADGWLATWPMGAAGWLAVLGLSCVGRSFATLAALLLALAVTLTPLAAPVLPLAVLALARRDGPKPALRVAALAVGALALSLLARTLAGWATDALWATPAGALTAGAHDLWWLLLEGLVTKVSPTRVAFGLPIYVWAILVWLPCYALSGLALWRGAAGLPLTAGYAVFSFSFLATGRTPADAVIAALLVSPVAARGKWWGLLVGCVLVTSLVNVALAPLSVPPPAPRAAVDLRTLNALARLVVLVGWTAALLYPLWAQLPERWRRVVALEPPPAARL